MTEKKEFSIEGAEHEPSPPVATLCPNSLRIDSMMILWSLSLAGRGGRVPCYWIGRSQAGYEEGIGKKKIYGRASRPVSTSSVVFHDRGSACICLMIFMYQLHSVQVIICNLQDENWPVDLSAVVESNLDTASSFDWPKESMQAQSLMGQLFIISHHQHIRSITSKKMKFYFILFFFLFFGVPPPKVNTTTEQSKVNGRGVAPVVMIRSVPPTAAQNVAVPSFFFFFRFSFSFFLIVFLFFRLRSLLLPAS